MPFQSKAQQRYMFAQHPRIAKRWAKETQDIKDLPEKIDPSKKEKPMKKKASDGMFFEKQAQPADGHFFRDSDGCDDGMFFEKQAFQVGQQEGAQAGYQFAIEQMLGKQANEAAKPGWSERARKERNDNKKTKEGGRIAKAMKQPTPKKAFDRRPAAYGLKNAGPRIGAVANEQLQAKKLMELQDEVRAHQIMAFDARQARHRVKKTGFDFFDEPRMQSAARDSVVKSLLARPAEREWEARLNEYRRRHQWK